MAKTKEAPVSQPKAHIIGSLINKTPVNTEAIEAMTPETDRMVSGVFRNVETPGQPAKICCRLYKGMRPFNQVLEDGQNYTIPLSVARHINSNCCYPIHGYLLDDKGNQVKGIGRYVHRYQFVSQDFN